MSIFGKLFHRNDDLDGLPPLDEVSSSPSGDDFSKLTGIPPMHERAKDLHSFASPFGDDSSRSVPSFSQPGSPPVQQGFSSMPQPSFSQSNSSSGQSSQIDGRDIQLIVSKLDLLKSSIDQVNDRLARLEKLVEERSNIFRGRF